MVVQEQFTFDYFHLAPDVRGEVQEHTRRLHELERRTSEGIIEMGHHLIAVKARLKTEGGLFGTWIDAEFGWTDRTARNFMQVAEVFGNKTEIISDFAPTALIALASGSVPESIREGFQQVAEAGHKVTNKDVQEAIAEHREQQDQRSIIEPASDEEKRTGVIPFDEDEDDEPVIEGEYVDASDVRTYLWDVPPSSPKIETKAAHVSYNSGENEWYTPAQYIHAARDVMGGIDLDPASSVIANETVQATTFYAKDDNGLAQKWHGRVWMNPPYAQPMIMHFCEKLADHVDAGDVTEAISLVNNATDTRWFQRLAAASDAVCFPKGRIRFLDPEGNPGAPLQGQAILYCGPRRDDFERAFVSFGVVL